MKPYIVRAREDLLTHSAKPAVYQDGSACGVKFHSEKGALLHDTGPRFRGRDPYAMALRGAHFIIEGTRIPGGREGL